MKFIEFVQLYPDEESCKNLFKTYRNKEGIQCKKCGSKEHYWQQTISQYQCKKCGFRTTLRSGTVMESSNLPYRYWIYAIYLMTMTKKGISALEMQRQLGHKRYQPIWEMMHKIRAAMGNRDSKYELEGIVEADDAFFESYTEEDNNEDQQKRGRGSSKQSKVLVMAKVVPKVGRPKKHKKPSAFRFVKMIVIEDSSSVSINCKVIGSISEKAFVKTDGWRGFNKLPDVISRHIKKVVPPKEASKVLPWVHTMISNAKRNLLGKNHSIKKDYMQNYLNEFCYKTNRRAFNADLFERLMVASVEDAWYGKLVYNNG